MPHSSGCIIFCLHELVRVCDRKNIACYRERTTITSPNRLRHEQHKKAVIWHKLQAFAGYLQAFAGKVQSLQMPVISLILYCKRLTLYCKFLHSDRSLLTVDGYHVGNCKSQRIIRLSSASPFVINIGRSSGV